MQLSSPSSWRTHLHQLTRSLRRRCVSQLDAYPLLQDGINRIARCRTGCVTIGSRFASRVRLPPSHYTILLIYLLFYTFLLYLGLTSYHRAIVFSFGGSAFGKQIICVLASSCLLGAATLVAGKMRGRVREWNATDTRTLNHNEPRYRKLSTIDEGTESQYQHRTTTISTFLVSSSSLPPPPPSFSSSPSFSLTSRLIPFLTLILLFLPITLPLSWSLYTFSHPTSHQTALSAQINIILFTAIGIAVFTVLGILWNVCVLGRGRGAAKIFLLMLGLFFIYSYYSWNRAHTAYLRGLHTPAGLLFDERFKFAEDVTSVVSDDQRTIDGKMLEPIERPGWMKTENQFDVLAENNMLSSSHLSLLDTPSTLRYRRGNTACHVRPHTHLAEVLPRRAANWFTGLESCGRKANFAKVVDDKTSTTSPRQQLLSITCPSTPFSLTLSPDYISSRSTSSSDVHTRYYDKIWKVEMEMLKKKEEVFETEKKNAGILAAKSTSHYLHLGAHIYFQATCGSQEQYFVRFVQDEDVVKEVQKVKEVVFPDESSDGAASSTTPITPPPHLLNPPILLIFIDSLSRSHFHRSFPLTSRVLREKHEQARTSRESRERVYVKQREWRRVDERRKEVVRKLVKKKNADLPPSSSIMPSQTELSVATRKYDVELDVLEEEIMNALEEVTSSESDSTTLTSSSTFSPQHSIYEYYLYHVLDYHTRGNMHTMLCAAGANGWGGSFTSSSSNGEFNPSQPSYTTGRGRMQSPHKTDKNTVVACSTPDLIWNRLKHSGYTTGFLLNECTDIFYELFGKDLIDTKKGKSAHYDLLAPFCHPEYDGAGEWSNFIGPFSMRRRCIAGRYVHEYNIDYAKQFIKQHDKEPWFLHLSFVEAHEGSLAIVRLLDSALAEFLTWIYALPPESTPIIILASDHGSHMGPFTEFSDAGYVENKLPLLLTSIPEQWVKWWDVEVKGRNLRELRKRKQEGVNDAATAPSSASTVAYYTQHPDIFSSFPLSSYPLSLSHELSSSLGLSFHENQYSLVTSREVYWFVRGIPQRVEKEGGSEREKKWSDAEVNEKMNRIDYATELQETGRLPDHRLWSLQEFTPASLATRISVQRRCDEAGVIDDLCICNKDKRKRL